MSKSHTAFVEKHYLSCDRYYFSAKRNSNCEYKFKFVPTFAVTQADLEFIADEISRVLRAHPLPTSPLQNFPAPLSYAVPFPPKPKLPPSQ